MNQYINDIYCKKGVPLNDIIEAMATKDINKVLLGFTPKNIVSFDNEVLHEENMTLFNNNKIMFPILSYA